MAGADRWQLEQLARPELVERGRAAGVERPEVLTRVELVDEILRISISDPDDQRRARGWLGVARDLLAGLVEQNLHLTDAAALIRGDGSLVAVRPGRVVATVTLAELYAKQGHVAKARRVLDEVLEKEPEHDVARELRDRLDDGEDEANDEEALTMSAPPLASNEDEPEPPRAPISESGAVTIERPRVELSGVVDDELEAVTLRRPPSFDGPPIDEAVAEPANSAATAPLEAVPPSADFAGASSPRSTEPPVTQASGQIPVEPPAAQPLWSLVVLYPRGTSAWIHWELRTALWQRLEGEGGAQLRIVSHVPRWSGAKRSVRQIELGKSGGSLQLSGFDAQAVLRAALGTGAGDNFVSHVVAWVTPATGSTWKPPAAPTTERVEQVRRLLQEQAAAAR